MTKEENKLLIRDLCCRVPYGVKVQYDMTGEDFDDDPIGDDTLEYCSGRFSAIGISEDIPTENLKPYLIPMDKMSNDEKIRMAKETEVPYDAQEPHERVIRRRMNARTEWLDKNMYDHREIFKGGRWMSMIEAGLALEAKKNMYKH